MAKDFFCEYDEKRMFIYKRKASSLFHALIKSSIFLCCRVNIHLCTVTMQPKFSGYIHANSAHHSSWFIVFHTSSASNIKASVDFDNVKQVQYKSRKFLQCWKLYYRMCRSSLKTFCLLRDLDDWEPPQICNSCLLLSSAIQQYCSEFLFFFFIRENIEKPCQWGVFSPPDCSICGNRSVTALPGVNHSLTQPI